MAESFFAMLEHELLAHNFALNTVQTLLRTLQDQGYATYTVDGRAHPFAPLVQRQDASRTAARQLLAGLFDRSPELWLSYLVREKPLAVSGKIVVA